MDSKGKNFIVILVLNILCPKVKNSFVGTYLLIVAIKGNVPFQITNNGKALPVVVILYSESWSEAGVSLPCQDLAAEGIVVVTVGYRLHLLAFLNFGTLTARGNLALLDQYLAFLWVRDNIAAFGGDPTTITLLGHSAGADSVLHHIVSPRSHGKNWLKTIFSTLNC